MNPLTRRLAVLSGGQPHLFPLAPQDRSRYVGLGATMVMTSLFAAVGMGILITQIGSLPIAATVALAAGWGLFVLSIDYLVVTFVDQAAALATATADPGQRARGPHRVRGVLRTFVRVVFAVLVGMAVGESLVIGVFSPAAVSYLDQQEEDRLLARLCVVDMALSQFRPEVQPAADCAARVASATSGVTTTTAPGSGAPATGAPAQLSASQAADVARLAELDKQILFYNDRAQCELYPDSFSAGRRSEIQCSGLAGNGQAHQAALTQVAKLEGEKSEIQARFSGQATAAAELEKARADADRTKAATQAGIDVAKRDSQPALDAVETKKQLEEQLRQLRAGDGRNYGLSERFDATEAAVSPWIRWGLRALFVLADLAPVLMKTTMGPSVIDQWKAIWARRQMLRELAAYEQDRAAYESRRRRSQGAMGDTDEEDEDRLAQARQPYEWATWPPPGAAPRPAGSRANGSNSSGASRNGTNGARHGGSHFDADEPAPSPRRNQSVPLSSQAVVEARYAPLVPAFEAIGWKTWSDEEVDIEWEELGEIGQLGKITVFDLSADNKARERSELYFARHIDFPDFPLVVKCARRAEIHRGRRPSYWATPTEEPPDIPLHSVEAKSFEEPAYHLANEIEFAEAVKGLPYIVPAVSSGHAGLINGRWHAYVVYPYFPNLDLDEYAFGRRLSTAQFQRIGRTLHTALEGVWVTAQQRHRDIKLSNLLVDGEGGVWLTDFEVASAMGALTTRPQKTIAFAAAEVLKTDLAPLSRFVAAMAADAYSVGAVLYTLKTGFYPHGDVVPKHGPHQEVNEKELAELRAASAPSKPNAMGMAAWRELATLLDPDPYLRVGLDPLGLRAIVERAGLGEGLDDLTPPQALRAVEDEDPDGFQRALSDNVLGSISRFLDAEDTPALPAGSR